MVSKEELEAAIEEVGSKVSGVSDKLTDFSADFTAALKALQDKIDAGGTGPDLAPSMTALASLGTKLDAIATSLADLDTTAENTSGVKTPPAA